MILPEPGLSPVLVLNQDTIMAEEAIFRCLRCTHEFKMSYDPKGPLVERACPKCKSNSVRRLKEKKK